MQLISTLLLLLSIIILVGALLFVTLWHNAHRKTAIVQMLREGIGHIGISAIVEYPDTPSPLLALLEEEYPHSEAVIITDLQHYLSPFGELIGKFHLVQVNHSHLEGVRALYRSRHRAFRRVVMIDLPIEHRARATNIAKRVASYDYILRLEGESLVARNTITYCANIIASHNATEDISLESFVGAKATLEKCDTPQRKERIRLRSGRVLAWRKERYLLSGIALFLPSAMVAVAYFSGNKVVLMTAWLTALAIGVFLYISYRVVAEKSLFATLDTILHNFYRFLVEQVKNFHYLYKERRFQIKIPDIKGVKIFVHRGDKHKQL